MGGCLGSRRAKFECILHGLRGLDGSPEGRTQEGAVWERAHVAKPFFARSGRSRRTWEKRSKNQLMRVFAFGIIYLFWPSDDAYFYYINRSAILIYSYCVYEASSQSFVVNRYGANKCVC